MANRKKTKEEKTLKSKQENVTSNIEERIDWNKAAEEVENAEKGASLEDYENSELNKQAVESLEQELTETPESEVETPKLRVLADDRLNSLINRANELGITDVVQILNSDKFGQFYLVYKG